MRTTFHYPESSYGRTYADVITKISRMDSLPNYLSYGAPLASASRAQGAPLWWNLQSHLGARTNQSAISNQPTWHKFPIYSFYYPWSDQQDSNVDSLKSKFCERARAMKQDGQPINLLPRYVHSRRKPLVEQQQQQLPTTRKEDFHCQFAGCTKICKSAGGLTLHVRRMQGVQFWSKVNELSILLPTIFC